MSYRSSSSSSNTRGSAPRPPSYGSSSSHRSSMNTNSAPPRKPAVTSSMSSQVSPVCVHCRNLGLSFDHWLRQSPEPDSPVVCPVLLKTECRYCHELGHTVGSCPAKKRSMARQNSSFKSVSSYPQSNSNCENTDLYDSTVLHNNGMKRVEVGSLFASKKESNSGANTYASNGKRIDVGSLFSPVPVSLVEKRTDITYRQFTYETPTQVVTPSLTPHSRLVVDADGLQEHPYSASYGDPEVDRQIAERRALFTSGKSWAEICYDDDDEDK